MWDLMQKIGQLVERLDKFEKEVLARLQALEGTPLVTEEVALEPEENVSAPEVVESEETYNHESE